VDALAWLDRHRDQVLAAALAGLYALEVLLTDEVESHHGSAALVGAVFASTLTVRRTLPLLPLLAAAVVIQLGHTVLPGLAEGGAFMIGLLVSIFSAGSYLLGRQLVVAGACVAGLILLAASATGSSSSSSWEPPSSQASSSVTGASVMSR
jgi:hypothetical protein